MDLSPLHKLIGGIIQDVEAPNSQLILDPLCGGTHMIQLFFTDEASFATRACCVDAAIIVDGRVKVIVEVEETGLRPVQLCGKVFVCLLASHFIHRGTRYPLAESVGFIQVIRLHNEIHKLSQCRQLRQSIRDILARVNGRVTTYEIFHWHESEFESEKDRQELVTEIAGLLKAPASTRSALGQ